MHFYADVMHIAMREYQGTPGESGSRLFNKKHLTSMVARAAHPISVAASFILLSIDPAQGGSCAWGLCACYYDVVSNLQVILHLDAVRLDDVTPEGIKNQIYLTILSLRNRNSRIATIPILIACEAAPKVISTQIAWFITMLEEEELISDVYTMREIGSSGDAGVPKTNANTQQMVAYTQLLLDHEQVAFSVHFGTLTDFPNSSVDARTAIKHLLISQLNNFQKREIFAERTDVTPRYRIDGKSGNQDDDLAVAYVMNVHWYLTAIMSVGQKYHHVTGGSNRCVTPGLTLPSSKKSSAIRNKHVFGSEEPTSTAEIQASYVAKRQRLQSNDEEFDRLKRHSFTSLSSSSSSSSNSEESTPIITDEIQTTSVAKRQHTQIINKNSDRLKRQKSTSSSERYRLPLN